LMRTSQFIAICAAMRVLTNVRIIRNIYTRGERDGSAEVPAVETMQMREECVQSRRGSNSGGGGSRCECGSGSDTDVR
jgi:hypothetical protein